jgi:hypothetical protein
MAAAGAAEQARAAAAGMRRPGSAPAPSQNSGNAAGTRPITVLAPMALLTGEDHQGLATASRLRWGLLLSEP